MAARELSSNWKQLQEVLKKTRPATALERKSTESSAVAAAAKKPKRHPQAPSRTSVLSHTNTPSSSTSTTITSAGPRSKPESGPPLKMAAQPLTSASLALWAEDNDISAVDLSRAYDLPLTTTAIPSSSIASAEAGKYISIDCEMVGVGGSENERSALARVSIVNYHGHVILDTFVRPKEQVTDWRTWVSGVRAVHMSSAREFEDVQKEVAQILDGRVLVGHAVAYDLEALLLSHPRRDTRDTSRHPGFRKLSAGRTPGLKKLSMEILGIEIQGGEHSSIEDARACMLLYRKFKDDIEQLHKPKIQSRVSGRGANGKKKGKKRKSKA